MADESAQVFTRHHEKDIIRIRSHVFGEKIRLTKSALDYDANALYFYCSGNAMSCGKDTLVVNEKTFDKK